MLIDVCLPTSDIYQSTIAPNCFKSHTNYWCPDFIQKILPDVRFETHLVRRNIFSTRQSFRALKKSYLGFNSKRCKYKVPRFFHMCNTHLVCFLLSNKVKELIKKVLWGQLAKEMFKENKKYLTVFILN